MPTPVRPANYLQLLANLKKRIHAARMQALMAVNKEMLSIYWEIGCSIVIQEQRAGWGKKIIDKLARDLKKAFPDMQGLSTRNLRYMRDFYLAYPEFSILQQPAAKLQSAKNKKVIILQQAAAKLPWGQHQVLLDRVKKKEERLFYLMKCADHGWSRNVLIHQLESKLHKRQGALTNNFSHTLPAEESDLAIQTFKDPYTLDFLNLSETIREADLENALTQQITHFLLELGDGFAFVGRQFKIVVGGREYIVDLIFYSTKLRRYIIIELKIGQLEPEHVGKMNFYLGLVDDHVKQKDDAPSIGLILCKTNNRIIAEYALRDIGKPIGIAEYKITRMLPAEIKRQLPSLKSIEQNLVKGLNIPPAKKAKPKTAKKKIKPAAKKKAVRRTKK